MTAANPPVNQQVVCICSRNDPKLICSTIFMLIMTVYMWGSWISSILASVQGFLGVKEQRDQSPSAITSIGPEVRRIQARTALLNSPVNVLRVRIITFKTLTNAAFPLVSQVQAESENGTMKLKSRHQKTKRNSARRRPSLKPIKRCDPLRKLS